MEVRSGPHRRSRPWNLTLTGYKKIHELKTLFNMLPEKIRKTIRSETMSDIPKKKEGDLGIGSFEDELENCSKHFEEVRYFYEQPTNKMYSIKFLVKFCDAVFNQDPLFNSRSSLVYLGDDKIDDLRW